MMLECFGRRKVDCAAELDDATVEVEQAAAGQEQMTTVRMKRGGRLTYGHSVRVLK